MKNNSSGMEWEEQKMKEELYRQLKSADFGSMAKFEQVIEEVSIFFSKALSEVYKKGYIKGEEEGFISGQNYPRTDENTKRLLGEARADEAMKFSNLIEARCVEERRKVVEEIKKEVYDLQHPVGGQKVAVDSGIIVNETLRRVLLLPFLSLTKETE